MGWWKELCDPNIIVLVQGFRQDEASRFSGATDLSRSACLKAKSTEEAAFHQWPLSNMC